MKKLILSLIILITTAPAFSHSIFHKDEEIQVNKSAPFLINIYSDHDDTTIDFEEVKLNYNSQVHFLNKKISTEEKKSKNNLFISATRSSSVNQNKTQSDTIEFATNYNIGKWDLKSGIAQETVSGLNQYYNYISFEPTYKINDNLSLFGGISHAITDNYDQTSFGIQYTPTKFQRLIFKIGVANYTKQFSSYRNKLKFETIFKI